MGNKDRKLKLGEKPTEEISQLPIYETTRKIPTGRMDLKERQRLREQMDMLDIRREENIAKRRAATKEKFLKHIIQLKEEDERRKEEQQAKINEERQNRYKQKEDMESREEEELKAVEKTGRKRNEIIEKIEMRTLENEEFELAQIRLRWKASDAKKAAELQADRDKREKVHEEARIKKAEEDKKRSEAHKKRKLVWKQYADRIKRKEDAWMHKIFEKKAEIKRDDKMQKERNQESLKEWHSQRWPIFAAAIRSTEERRLARESEEEAVKDYQDRRAIPKKEKTKGKAKKKKQEEPVEE